MNFGLSSSSAFQIGWDGSSSGRSLPSGNISSANSRNALSNRPPRSGLGEDEPAADRRTPAALLLLIGNVEPVLAADEEHGRLPQVVERDACLLDTVCQLNSALMSFPSGPSTKRRQVLQVVAMPVPVDARRRAAASTISTGRRPFDKKQQGERRGDIFVVFAMPWPIQLPASVCFPLAFEPTSSSVPSRYQSWRPIHRCPVIRPTRSRP